MDRLANSLKIAILLAVSDVAVVVGYGFTFPRHYDQLVVGDTVNLTWSSMVTHISLKLIPGSIVGNVRDKPHIDIAKNISSVGWYEWAIPRDISTSILGAHSTIDLVDGFTELVELGTEYVTIVASSQTPIPSPTSLGQFTAPTGAPERSLKEGSLVNITWDTKATYVNLTFWSDANQPWTIFNTTRNPGWYHWTVIDITSFSLPQYFKLVSNDTEFAASPTIDSEGFYIEPSNYPVATLEPLSDTQASILYPRKSDTSSIAVNDTVVLAWDKPVTKRTDLSLIMICETYYTWRYYDRFFDNYTYTPTNLTFRIDEFVGFTDVMYGSSFHINLMEETHRSHWSQYAHQKLIARSDSFLIVEPSGPENTWIPSPERLATASATSTIGSTSTSIPGDDKKSLSTGAKIAIGVAVPLGVLALLALGFLGIRWRRRRAVAGIGMKLPGPNIHEIGSRPCTYQPELVQSLANREYELSGTTWPGWELEGDMGQELHTEMRGGRG